MSDKIDLFAGLKREIIEYAGGEFLRLKDGESVVVSVDVDLLNADPTKRTPRFEDVDNFNKTNTEKKMRFDCQLGSTKKVFYTTPVQSREIIAILDRGVRKIKISRFGSGATSTKYVYAEAQ